MKIYILLINITLYTLKEVFYMLTIDVKTYILNKSMTKRNDT